jgi:hypothetical protein
MRLNELSPRDIGRRRSGIFKNIVLKSRGIFVPN